LVPPAGGIGIGRLFIHLNPTGRQKIAGSSGWAAKFSPSSQGQHPHKKFIFAGGRGAALIFRRDGRAEGPVKPSSSRLGISIA
jgi:hypothetical protein